MTKIRTKGFSNSDVPTTRESIGDWNSCKMFLIYGRTIRKVARWGRGRRRSTKKLFVQGEISRKKVALKNRLLFTFLMVRPLKDNKATFSPAVIEKVQPIRKMQRHWPFSGYWFFLFSIVEMDWTSGRSVVRKLTVKASSLGNLFCNLPIVIVICRTHGALRSS